MGQGLEGQDVSLGTDTADDTCDSWGHIGGVTERFPLVWIRNVDLDRRQSERFQRIMKRHRSVRIGPGVQNQCRSGEASLLHPVDQNALVVGLPERDG